MNLETLWAQFQQTDIYIKCDNFLRYFIYYGSYKEVLHGLLITVEIAVIGLIIGIAIGTIIAVVRVTPKYKKIVRFLDKIADLYVWFFRGTPIVVQLLIGYYILLPAFGIAANSTLTAIVIFGLNSGAYVSEIMRSGIQSVDVGQLEAGRALGLSYPQTMIKIIIPQAIKNILPTIGNEFIVLIKETSVLSFISVIDLKSAFDSISSSTYDVFIPYIALAFIYLIIVTLITVMIRLIEKRFKRSER